MALTLAFLEGLVLLVAVCGSIVLWGAPTIWRPLDILFLVWKGIAVSCCCVVAFYYNDLYDLRIVRGFNDFTSRLLQSFGVAFILLAGFYTLFPRTNVAGGPFASALFLVLGLLLPLRAISYQVMRSGMFVERVLVLGLSPLSRALIREMQMHLNSGLVLVGVIDDGTPGPAVTGCPVLGSLGDVKAVLTTARPDRVVVALADRRSRLPIGALLEARLRRIPVVDGTEMYERLMGKLAIEAMTPSTLIFSERFLKSRVDLGVGRAVSFVTALLGLILLAPLLALIALAVRLDSRGPALFVQDRAGMHGSHFRLFKFRTMHPSGDIRSEWVRDNHDRITRVGKWLRRFRLDELPQFINILRGDMNLVGPRPHPVSNFELFMQRIPYYGLRGAVRPGVTGWAQIRHGYANGLEEETEKMRYDLYYVKHLSLWLDFRILFDTVKIVLFGRGAMAGDAYAGHRASADAAADTNGVNGHAPTEANGQQHPAVAAPPAKATARSK